MPISNNGYVVINVSGKSYYEHRLIWEEAYGEIPKGYQIHHKDGDKQNNDIENLQLVSTVEHKRFHGGCFRKDGHWYKPCRTCGEVKSIEREYFETYDKRTGKYHPRHECKDCFRINNALRKRAVRNRLLG